MNSTTIFKRFLPHLVGAEFEKSAECHLNRNGLRTICRNYQCRAGEIDLIMEDSEFIIFVEVRYRSDDAFGKPLESITAAKQKRIIRAATHFLARKPELGDMPCRFDAVGVTRTDGRVEYDWIKDAFST